MAHFSMTLPSLGENVPKTTMNFQGTIAVLLQFGEVDLVRKLAKFFGSTATKTRRVWIGIQCVFAFGRL